VVVVKVAGALALVVGFAVLAAVCAVLVNDQLPERYTANGVMVASPKQPPGGTASPELVRTYAELIKADPSVIRSIAEATDQSRSEAEDALRVRPDENSLLVRVSVDAGTREESLAGLDAVSKGFRTGKASAVLDPENIQLLDRKTEEIALPEPGYRATRSVLITTPPPSSGDPQGPSRLAADFAGVIPQDDELLEHAGKKAGKSAEDVRKELTVRAASNTSVMNFSMRSSDYDEGRTTLVALMKRLRDHGGGAGRVNAGDLRVAHLPDTDPPAARSSLPSAIIGAVVGACIGAMLALGLARRRRIRHPQPA
jgi:capsular polysaccharide biosynthesis protein